MGCRKCSSKREVYSNTILSQETRKPSNRHLTLYLKKLEKEGKKPKLVERNNRKHPSRKKQKRNERNNSKD